MITRWMPDYVFGNIWRLQDEINRMFDERFQQAAKYPAMNVWSGKEDVLVEVEIPGIEPKDVEVAITGNVLEINGQRQPKAVRENEVYHRRERKHGVFSRSLELPYAVDSSKAQAVFRNGVLSVTLPRAEEDKPCKIAVKAE